MRAELRIALAAGASALALAAAGCGAAKKPITIGVLADCVGVFGGEAAQEYSLAGVELPLLERGAELAGKQPSAGVVAAELAGKPVKLVFGCSLWSVLRDLVEQSRWLIEKEEADIIIGPTFGLTEGLVLREVARQHPEVTFVLGVSQAQETTLRDPASNVFRFGADGVQTSAGLGSYAYHRLGWRRAAVLAPDYISQWPEAAGFIAEFCALGGQVDRIETPLFSSAALAAKIPSGDDGVALMAGGAADTFGFAAAYAKLHPNLSKRLVLGTSSFAFLDRKVLASAGALLTGVVISSDLPFDGDDLAWIRFRAAYAKRFPGLTPSRAPSDFSFVLAYYNAAEAVIRALQQVHGDLSGTERRFQRALAKVRLQSPIGPVRLDRNRQAVLPNYLSHVVLDAGGKPTIRTLRVVPDVEQTFGGYFSASTPPLTKSTPTCRAGNPPPWAR